MNNYFIFFNYQKISNLIKNRISYYFTKCSKHYFLSGYPTFVSIETCNRCNLHCPECAVGKNLTTTKNFSLDMDLYISLLDEIGDKLLNTIFYFQGEPLLNKNFDKYILEAKKYNIYTQLSTNAQITSDETIDKIIYSKLDRIIISIDGITEENYQKYRIGGKLIRVIEFIEKLNSRKKELKSKYPLIEAQFIVFRNNEKEIDDFKLAAKKWGVNFISLKSAFLCDPNKSSHLIPSIDKYSRYRFEEKLGMWINKNKNKSVCSRAWSGAVINSDGEVLPCCFDKISTYSYGQLNYSNGNSFINLWKGIKATEFRKRLLHNRAYIDICNSCNE